MGPPTPVVGLALGGDFESDDDVREFVDQEPDINGGVPETNVLDGPTGPFVKRWAPTSAAGGTMSSSAGRTAHLAPCDGYYRARQFADDSVAHCRSRAPDGGPERAQHALADQPVEAAPRLRRMRAGLNELIGQARRPA